MKYKRTEAGVFLARPNRFTAWVEILGQKQLCHVKNTGRLGELFVPGAAVVVSAAENTNRKTAWDVIAVEKDGNLFNVDSQAPNSAAEEFLQRQYPGAHIRREVRFEDSRFDFFIETPTLRRFVEVKGVTLVENGTAMFPDAPTLRGKKHVEGLVRARRQGYEACVLFVVQAKGVSAFRPNAASDEAFCRALALAAQNGVEVRAYDCRVSRDEMIIDKPVKVKGLCLDL